MLRNVEEEIRQDLFAMQDLQYKKFHAKLIPTVDHESIIGVRTPELRAYAKKLLKTDKAQLFIKELPHKYYEENNLHAFILEAIKNYDGAIIEVRRFLPYIDNWATCDMFSPKIFAKNTDKLLSFAEECIRSSHIYSVRYGIGIIMKYYLDEHFTKDTMVMVASIRTEEYYIKMMIAWYFATALVKQYDSAITYIKEYKLDAWVHNKAIQKATESKRISLEMKEYLKSLKIKL